MDSTRALRRLIAVAALIVLGSAAPLHADYIADYVAGLEAAQRQDWPEAERRMRAAAAAKGSEGRVRIYGMRFDPYIPHYWLGVALFEQGDCSGALAAWQTSEGQGFITKLDEYGDLQERRRRCRERVARVEPTVAVVPTASPRPDVTAAVRSARDRIRAAEEAAAGLSPLRTDPSRRGAWDADPSLARRADQAGEALQSARAKLESGQRNASEAELAGAAALADQAGREFAAIRGDLDRLHQQLVRQAEQRSDREAALRQARADVGAAAGAARQVLQRADSAGVLPADARTERGRLEALVRQGDGAGRVTSVDSLRQLAEEMGSRTAALERILVAEARTVPTEPVPSRPAAPPRRLRTAAEAFFAGDYRQTLSLLEGGDFSDPRAVAAAHLLRAGASFSLFLAGGGQDDGLRRAALDELRLCRQARPELTLDPALFSPRFVEFARSTR